jgi:hypothetical protein
VKLCAQGRERQFIDHLAPIWTQLPAEVKTNFYVPTEKMQTYAATRGVDAVIGYARDHEDTTALVASFGDYNRTAGPVILMEHGIGHKYADHGSYVGGAGKDRVVLYLATNKVTKAHHLDAYPDVPVHIIGTPKLDTVEPREATGRTVCISFHWDCRVTPESRSAFNHYKNYLPRLGSTGRFELVAHSHPRPAWRQLMKPFFERRGIRFIDSFDQVLEEADVYITDNSSTGYEFAAAGRHTIHLNAPWYRKDVNTGIRFWDHLPGPTVDHPAELPAVIEDVLDNPDKWENQRKTVVRQLYPYRGTATKRAVQHITDFLT